MRLTFPDKFNMHNPRPNTRKVLGIYEFILPALKLTRNYSEIDVIGTVCINYLIKIMANLKCDLNSMAVYDYQTWGTWFGWFNE